MRGTWINTKWVMIIVIGFNLILLGICAGMTYLARKTSSKMLVKVVAILSHIGLVLNIASVSMVYGCTIAPYMIKLLDMEVIYMGAMSNLMSAAIGATVGYFVGNVLAKRDINAVRIAAGHPDFKETEDWDEEVAEDLDREIDCPPINNGGDDDLEEEEVTDEEINELLAMEGKTMNDYIDEAREKPAEKIKDTVEVTGGDDQDVKNEQNPNAE